LHRVVAWTQLGRRRVEPTSDEYDVLDALHGSAHGQPVSGVTNRNIDAKGTRSVDPPTLRTRQPAHAGTALEQSRPYRGAKETPSDYKDARLSTAPIPHFAA
jgi:hypothetical protein